MAEDTEVQIALRALASLDSISSPVTLDALVGRELTRSSDANVLLRSLSLGMLQQLKVDGMLSADDLALPGAKIYGLTDLGKQMYAQFRMLAGA